MVGCDSEDRGTGRTTFAGGGSVTHGNVKCPSVETEGAPVIKSWYLKLSRGATLNKARLSECGIQMGDLKELSQVAAHSEGDAAVANTTREMVLRGQTTNV